MKRALIGTILDLLSVPVNSRVISIFFIVSANIFYVLMFLYSKNYIYPYHKKLFYFLFGFFVISPFTAWNWGYDYGRSDIYLLVIELLVLYSLRKNFNAFHYAIPFYLIAGLLIHEGFLFLNVPVILAIMMYNYRQRLLPLHLLILSCIAIVLCMIILVLYGKVSEESLAVIYFEVYNKKLPGNLSWLNPTAIITSPLKSNISLSFYQYLSIRTWTFILYIIPFVFAYIYLYVRLFFYKKYSMTEKMIFVSPFLGFPMFILGIDIYRWASMIFINILLAAIFLYRSRPVNLTGIDLKQKLMLGIVLFYCLSGPIGTVESLPFLREMFIKK